MGAKPKSSFQSENGLVVPMDPQHAAPFVKMVLLQLGQAEFYDVFVKQSKEFMSSHAWGEDRRLLAMMYVFREWGTVKPAKKWKLWVEQFCLSNPMRLFAPKYAKDVKGNIPFTDSKGKIKPVPELAKRYLFAANALDLSVEVKDAIRSINGRMLREAKEVEEMLKDLSPQIQAEGPPPFDLSVDPGAPTTGVLVEHEPTYKAPEEYITTKDTWAGVKPISGREEMAWVKNHLALSGVTPEDCPGPGAWAMFLNARSDPETFWRTWQSQVVKEDDQNKGKDAIALATSKQVDEFDKLMELMRKEADGG